MSGEAVDVVARSVVIAVATVGVKWVREKRIVACFAFLLMLYLRF